jgi:mono/diheme cytochrome c family protein
MKKLRTLALATAIAILIAAFVLISAAARTANVDDFDAAATYKGKCVACHGAAAEKRFDSTLADADLVQILVKGKKAEKPPNMPGYEEKGITEDQAKALLAYMKSLKK